MRRTRSVRTVARIIVALETGRMHHLLRVGKANSETSSVFRSNQADGFMGIVADPIGAGISKEPVAGLLILRLSFQFYERDFRHEGK
jgi:hypothetical protein